MGILIVKLKTIKYKEDSFYHLSFYPPDLGLQAACFLTLSFRSYAFRTFVSSAECIHSSKSSRILDPFYNLNPHLLSSSLIPKRSTSLAASGLTEHQRAILVTSNKPCLLPPTWWFQRLKILCRSKMLSRNHASY